MKALDSMAQNVWAATSIEEKRARLCEMIDNFQYKSKAEQYKRDALLMTSAYKLNNFTAQLLLRNGNQVIK